MSSNSRKQRLELRNERIRERFAKLTSAPKHHSTEHALDLLSDEFLELTKDTIWLIISQTGFYSNKKQNEKNTVTLTLFSHIGTSSNLL